MPYSIKEGPCQTAEGIGGQYAVIKDDDGMQMGCHQTREAAVDQVAALEASEELKVLPEAIDRLWTMTSTVERASTTRTAIAICGKTT